MKKHPRREKFSAHSPAEPDVAGLISRIEQRLVSLESKIDALVNQSSRPPQRFDNPNRHADSRHGDNFRDRERRLYRVICADCNKECEVPFKPSGDRPVYCKDCFTSRKGVSGGQLRERPDNKPQGGVFEREQRFDKHESGEKRVFDRKKKPFSYKKKNRAK